MEIKQVWTLCYSATGVTDQVTGAAAAELAARLEVPLERIPFTRPAERAGTRAFGPGDLVVVGSPTYAGRLPNKIAPSFQQSLLGQGALAVAVVTFGNRGYENSLAELVSILEGDGFHTVAAGAFVGRHAFTDELAYGRPGWSDLFEIKNFAKAAADKIRKLTEIPSPVQVPGDPAAPYYIPKGVDGAPVKFLQAKPVTDLDKCVRCGLCARLCPMGAINPRNVAEVPGTCIKCQCCVRKCTRHAKSFDDPNFLSHVAMLERDFQEPKENETFL